MKVAMLSTTRSGHNFIKEVIESWGDYDITVMERTLPENIYQYNLDPRSIRLIVIRDFRNCLASSIKSYLDTHGWDSPWRDNIDVTVKSYWAQIKEAITGEYYDADIIIYYDRFCEDRAYREDICARLGGIYTESRLGFVSSEGNGSSWDKLTKQGKGEEMKTRSRYEQIMDTPWAGIYVTVLQENEENMQLYETFFKSLR